MGAGALAARAAGPSLDEAHVRVAEFLQLSVHEATAQAQLARPHDESSLGGLIRITDHTEWHTVLAELAVPESEGVGWSYLFRYR